MWQAVLEARWAELSAFFSAGNPPIITQILVLNTLVFLVHLIRKARGANKLQSHTAYYVQGVLILANLYIIFERNLSMPSLPSVRYIPYW
ncbi:MAG TPA: hypothetical protein PKE19_04365 [Aestuariivirga sp.]|nr:hypothetical protein [Aestuariivirga sp.]